MSIQQYLEHPWGTQWRKALLSLPRAVPHVVLHLTSPEGPHPIIIKLPSRSRHMIPVYAFIPPNLSKSIKSSSEAHGKVSVLIDFHGGGFVYGSCQEQAPFCAMFARELGCLVLSVDYRMGPNDKFPAAIEDAEDVLSAVHNTSGPGYHELRKAINRHIASAQQPIAFDHHRTAVSGFSSGGNLALNLALSIKPGQDISSPWPSVISPTHPQPIPILLFYPSLDCRQLPSERPRPAGLEPKPGTKAGFLASLRLEDELMPTYLPRDQASHPRASPGLAEIANGGLHGKAKIFLVLPELDTLSAQSDAWIEKVASEGRDNDLVVERVKDVLHGWTQFPDSWLSDDHKRLKAEIFEKAKNFVKSAWEMA